MPFDSFIKIGDIKGESTDDKHKNWIEILSFSHGVFQRSSGEVSAGTRSAGRCDHGSFHIVKTLDQASPYLYLKCCNGEHIKEATVQICKAGGDKQQLMEFKMSDVMITSVAPAGSAEGAAVMPMEEVAMTYGKIEWCYSILDHATGKKTGDVKTHWDLHTNKGG